ncbi:MAG: FHA domain-containing protein [Microscillaceae bacterium]|jgi:hypothetical protein|nr:FHA domain-containing protein [Microscillaceae bacterium]
MKIIRFGRANDNQVIIADPTVSAKHLAITQTETGELYAQDLGSSNGTLVNQIPIGKAPFLLKSGDIIKIGQTTLSWEEHFLLPTQTESVVLDGSLLVADAPVELVSQVADNEPNTHNTAEKSALNSANDNPRRDFDRQNNQILLWAVWILLFLLLIFIFSWYMRNVVRPSLNFDSKYKIQVQISKIKSPALRGAGLEI